MNYKEIIGYENYIIFKTGKVYSKKSKRFLKGSKDSSGYICIDLKGKNGRKYEKLHRIVGLHFINNTENKTQIDHIDRNRTNNNFNNLRWVTHYENQQNTGVRKTNKLGEKYICIHRETHYKLKITKLNYNKTFKINDYSLQDVINIRNNLL